MRARTEKKVKQCLRMPVPPALNLSKDAQESQTHRPTRCVKHTCMCVLPRSVHPFLPPSLPPSLCSACLPLIIHVSSSRSIRPAEEVRGLSGASRPCPYTAMGGGLAAMTGRS
mmetsp:Transcript_9484/g.23172  ORF Transcript_9484/g.23172 Transcript_9484/m.23172 type:complete len:113 (-) Transcript_9484:155-493(-)